MDTTSVFSFMYNSQFEYDEESKKYKWSYKKP